MLAIGEQAKAASYFIHRSCNDPPPHTHPSGRIATQRRCRCQQRPWGSWARRSGRCSWAPSRTPCRPASGYTRTAALKNSERKTKKGDRELPSTHFDDLFFFCLRCRHYTKLDYTTLDARQPPNKSISEDEAKPEGSIAVAAGRDLPPVLAPTFCYLLALNAGWSRPSPP